MATQTITKSDRACGGIAGNFSSQMASVPSYLLNGMVSNARVLGRIIESLAGGYVTLEPVGSNGGVRKGPNIAELKPRVLAVISLMAQGHSNWGIAKRLGIQPKTVENYINCIYQALCLTHESDVHSRVHAVLSYLEYIGAPLAREYEPVG